MSKIPIYSIDKYHSVNPQNWWEIRLFELLHFLFLDVNWSLSNCRKMPFYFSPYACITFKHQDGLSDSPRVIHVSPMKDTFKSIQSTLKTGGVYLFNEILKTMILILMKIAHMVVFLSSLGTCLQVFETFSSTMSLILIVLLEYHHCHRSFMTVFSLVSFSSCSRPFSMHDYLITKTSHLLHQLLYN